MNKPQLIHCTVDGHLGYFYFIGHMSKATTNILLEMSIHFFWMHTQEWTCWLTERTYA